MKFTVIVLTSLFVLTHLSTAAQTLEPEIPEQEQEPVASQPMTQAEMKRIISEIAEEVEGEANNLSFYYNGANLALLSDANANRMRIIAPVIEAKNMSEEQIVASLLSNYHLALDARYAIGNGVLYSVYIHPLKELTEDQLISAVRQVATLRNTFGTSYSSGELSFGLEAKEEKIDL